MKRASILALVVILIAIPSPARAFDPWEWLSDFSGAGPFRGDTWPGVNATLCRQDAKWKPSPIGKDGASPESTIMPCVYFDVGLFVDDDDDTQGYPTVHVKLSDFGVNARLRDWLDAGVGVGILRITNERTAIVKNQLTITPFRVVWRPHLLVSQARRHHLEGLVGIYAKGIYIPGSLTGADFGQIPPPGVEAFHVPHDFLWSGGLILDLTALFHR